MKIMVNALNKFILSLIYSNVYLASAAACLHLSVCKFLHVPCKMETLFVLFTILVTFYNICQFIGIKGKEKNDMSPLQLFVAKNMTELIFMLFFISGISLYLFIQLIHDFNVYILIGLSVAGFLYLWFNDRIQNAPSIKPLYISLCWMLFIFLPIQHPFDKSQLFLAGLIWAFIFLLCLLYDQKDRQQHLFQHLNTVVKTAIIVFGYMLFSFLSLEIRQSNMSYLSYFILVISLVFALSGMNKTNEKWHLTITDGQIYLLACLICSLR